MMQQLSYRLWNDWNLMRLLRLGLGIVFLGSGWDGLEWPVLLFGSILIVQGVFNLGCSTCAGGSCSYAATQMTPKKNEQDEFSS